MLSILEQIEIAPENGERPDLRQVEEAVLDPSCVSPCEATFLEIPAAAEGPMPETASSCRLGSEPGDTMWLAPPPATPPELQYFAEQFARNFLGSVNQVMKDAYALLTQDRRRVEATLQDLRGSLREAETFRSEMSSLRQRVESLEAGRQQLAGRLGEAEDHLSVCSSALNSFQETQLQFEKRLEVQAGAIRTLHNTVQSREDRFNKLFSTLHALHSLAAEATVPEVTTQGG